jgi:hypothetical protein
MRETGNYFRFYKGIVRLGHWQALEPAAKAVYPVIAIHANKKGYCYPHIKTIAKLSGRSNKTVHKGIADLKRYRLIKVRKKSIRRGFKANHYHVPSIAGEGDSHFPFHKELIRLENGKKGIWSELKPSEQALYVVMRTFTTFDAHLYCEMVEYICGYPLSVADFDEWFPLREFEWCQMSNYQLADWAGISRQRIPSTLRSLQKRGLIEGDYFGWIVSFRRRMPDP